MDSIKRFDPESVDDLASINNYKDNEQCRYIAGQTLS